MLIYFSIRNFFGRISFIIHIKDKYVLKYIFFLLNQSSLNSRLASSTQCHLTYILLKTLLLTTTLLNMCQFNINFYETEMILSGMLYFSSDYFIFVSVLAPINSLARILSRSIQFKSDFNITLCVNSQKTF